MTRCVRWWQVVGVAGLFTLGVTPLKAQVQVEFAPFAGYNWGGTLETDRQGTIPSGEVTLENSFTWGGIMSFIFQPGTALEVWYLRQDNQLLFKSELGSPQTVGDFATNYIQFGGRWGLPIGEGFNPFISASMGMAIFEPPRELDGSTRFSWSLGGGFLKMMSPKMGIRTDIRWLATPVPSGDYATWCGFYGCYAAEGTDWISQGQVSGGLIIAF
jgi:hypothetical protein